MIRLVTIDLDDTLWECEPVILRAEQALYDWLSSNFPRITSRYSMMQMRERRLAMREEDARFSYDFGALRRASMARHAREAGYREDDLIEPGMEVFLTARNQVELYEDVLPSLRQLHGKYLLAALTNGNADVERVGLSHLFHFALCPEHVGSAKPDPAMFVAACERAGVHPSAAVHVGDSPQHDIDGARAAGLRCVWMNRAGLEWTHTSAQPDAEIGALHELDAILTRWCAQQRAAR